MKKAYTDFEKWQTFPSNHRGHFQTKLFEAYAYADNSNRKILADGFPEWFVEKSELKFYEK